MAYISCEQYRFNWSDKELKAFRSMWLDGVDIESMAEKLKRRTEEVAFLIIDLADRSKIPARKNGCFGKLGVV